MNNLLPGKLFLRRIKKLAFRTPTTCSFFSTKREQLYYDVVTVGAGPAGLSAAIRLKQAASANNINISVCVVEKAAQIGDHILSGNVFETRALDELFPDWRSMDCPIKTKASTDEFLILGEKKSISIPSLFLPPQLNNHGNYIISLSALTRWLAERAEELGVEIYPGFSAAEVLYNKDGSVRGVCTREAGISKNGEKKSSYIDGIELVARQTFFAEGCRGSCSEEVIEKFQLRGDDKDNQTYGLGIKEIWEIPMEKFKAGHIQHTLGWPLQDSVISKTFGGTFLYHMEPNLVLLGMVVGLDYANPYLNPYKEFQRWKHHPDVSKHLEGGQCISYGARCLNEGGLHAIPNLSFPGGALVGCSAGFLNSVKIKGSHTAMKSGIIAADLLIKEFMKHGVDNTVAEKEDFFISNTDGVVLDDLDNAIKSSWIGEELHVVRNCHAAFHYGVLPGLLHSALSCFITRGNEPWTLKNRSSDSSKTQSASKVKEIKYEKPDGILSFELLTNLQRSGTNHDHDQPAHLRIKENCEHVPTEVSLKEYAGPEQRFCPAGVYEYTEADSNGQRQLQINAQNCVHCKCCSIKMPKEYIKWTVPEGGGGPSYTLM